MTRRFRWPSDSIPVNDEFLNPSGRLDHGWLEEFVTRRTAMGFAATWHDGARQIRPLLDSWRQRRAEAKRWAQAETWEDLCELVAQFCEGKLGRTPNHLGPRMPETVEISAELANANRHGFLTDGSQPGRPQGQDGYYAQRAAVTGYADAGTVAQLRKLVEGTPLLLHVSEFPQPRRGVTPYRGDYSKAVVVTRDEDATVPLAEQLPGWLNQVREWDNRRHGWTDETRIEPEHPGDITDFGYVPTKAEAERDYGLEMDGAKHVTIVDPRWGPHTTLWERLAQPDWDNPTPPPAETPMPKPKQPPEPPVGTVIQARDVMGSYSIERSGQGWHIQYPPGDPAREEYGLTRSPRPISWRAAWSAWGPPAGATKFDPAGPRETTQFLGWPQINDFRATGDEPRPGGVVDTVGDAVETYQDTKKEAAEAVVAAVTSTPPTSRGTTTSGGTGMSSAIGQVQATALDVADSLEQVGLALGVHVENLQQVKQSVDESLGESHQEDVPALQAEVDQAIEALGGCAETVGQAAQQTRDVEAQL